jgi:hypothetical protein
MSTLVAVEQAVAGLPAVEQEALFRFSFMMLADAELLNLTSEIGGARSVVPALWRAAPEASKGHLSSGQVPLEGRARRSVPLQPDSNMDAHG